ncbi:RNA polymerase sigma factor [Oceanobacter antarcticus]|uniref:RNA polymerase sigma factor n=1 Tax=Oceanobacter antarcticus TaxID=3133425 RepID=A0ABW8NII4_9GAMM
MKLTSQAFTARLACDKNPASSLPGDDDKGAPYEQQLTQDIPRLRRYIASQVNNPQEVDDLLQDTLLRSLRPTNHERISSPVAYALRVARSVVVDYWRAGKRQPELLESLPEAVGICMEDEHIDRQKLELLSKVVAAMPELRRQVFILRRVEGLSRDQIACQLGLADEAVKKHITRAMMDIAKAMAGAGYTH